MGYNRKCTHGSAAAGATPPMEHGLPAMDCRKLQLGCVPHRAPGGRLTDLHAKRPKVALAGTTGALHITWTKADMASTLAAHAVRVLGAR
jgi:hypothetical protein